MRTPIIQVRIVIIAFRSDGLRAGFHMRQMLIAAVFSKSLRLRTSQLARVTTGKITNLISNDVRRCDDACLFPTFLLVGPLELSISLLLLSLELGFLAALAGLSAMMLLVPCQVNTIAEPTHISYSREGL